MTPEARRSVNVCGQQPLCLVWGVSYTGVDMCENSSNCALKTGTCYCM